MNLAETYSNRSGIQPCAVFQAKAKVFTWNSISVLCCRIVPTAQKYLQMDELYLFGVSNISGLYRWLIDFCRKFTLKLLTAENLNFELKKITHKQKKKQQYWTHSSITHFWPSKPSSWTNFHFCHNTKCTRISCLWALANTDDDECRSTRERKKTHNDQEIANM